MKIPSHSSSSKENKSLPEQSQVFEDGNLLTASPPEMRSSSSPKSPSSPPSGGARRWEIAYGELKLEQKLGQGAFGEVFKGSYRKNPVAVKVYEFRGKLPTEQEEMLLKEADVMEGLRSDYLVGFRGICLDPRYCLVMEYCDGGTLRARLDKSSEAITPVEQMRWAMQIGYGLYQLHSVKIVHRDLKGENILLDKLNHAKVADFGLSIVKSNSASHSKTGTGRGGAGTIPWMAPELHEDKSNSVETDVYSLGVVLWEMVSRQLPFAGLMMGQMISKTLRGQRDAIPEKCPEVFRLMITACWDLDPKKRPTAEQVGDQFDAVLKSIESMPAPVAEAKLPKPAIAGAEDEQLKELLAEVMRLKLEKSEEERRRLAMEKMSEDKQRRIAELERRYVDEKEIQRQPQSPEPKDKSTPTPVKPVKPVDSKSASVQKPLSQSSQILMPPPKPAAKPVDEKALSQLLQFVVEGEQDKAEALIQKDPNLLLHAGTVTDLSGREFKQITAFQYALWAMDWHTRTMMQKYLSREAQTQQLRELETKSTAHGKHFSLQELTDALQVYVDNVEKVWNYDQRATDHWCKVVGGAQKKLPAHVVNEYCRGDRPFEPCPTEWESKLPRTREMNVWDSTQSKMVNGSWFRAPSSKDGLGLNFAFYRYSGARAGARGVWWRRARRDADLKALQSLWKTRTQQLELLKSELLPAASYSQVFGSSR